MPHRIRSFESRWEKGKKKEKENLIPPMHLQSPSMRDPFRDFNDFDLPVLALGAVGCRQCVPRNITRGSSPYPMYSNPIIHPNTNPGPNTNSGAEFPQMGAGWVAWGFSARTKPREAEREWSHVLFVFPFPVSCFLVSWFPS